MTMIEQLKACVIIATIENEFRTQLLAYIDCMSDFGKLVDELTEKNEQLKAQVKKMKCCGNCCYATNSNIDGTFCNRKAEYTQANRTCKDWS